MVSEKEEMLKAFASNLLALQIISKQLEELSSNLKSIEENMSKFVQILKTI